MVKAMASEVSCVCCCCLNVQQHVMPVRAQEECVIKTISTEGISSGTEVFTGGLLV